MLVFPLAHALARALIKYNGEGSGNQTNGPANAFTHYPIMTELWYIKTSIELLHTSILTQRNKKQEEESNEPKLQSSCYTADCCDLCMLQLCNSCRVSRYV